MLLTELQDCENNQKLRPDELAEKVLKYAYGDDIKFPVEPFGILNKFGIVFQLRSFEKTTSGFYIPPNEENDIPVVGINKNHIITRQRFSAAHELCHHLKDRKNECNLIDIKVSSITNENDPIEKYANEFASNLLMPKSKLVEKIREYSNENGELSLEKADEISKFFGTSFESCVYTLAYRERVLEGQIDSYILKERIKKYRAVNKKEINTEYHQTLYKDIVDNYSFNISVNKDNLKYKIKKNYVYNDTKIEGSNMTVTEVSELLANVRLNGTESLNMDTLSKDYLETLGESEMYDFIDSLPVDYDISIYDIKNIHAMLYKYSKFPDMAGIFRKVNNRIHNTNVETAEYELIDSKIYALSRKVDKLIDKRNQISKSEYIDEVLEIHHELTVIHPFHDGNGRALRGFMNMLFKINQLPIVYVTDDDKSRYLDSLRKKDDGIGITDMSLYIYDSMFDVLCELTNHHK